MLRVVTPLVALAVVVVEVASVRAEAVAAVRFCVCVRSSPALRTVTPDPLAVSV